MLAICTHMIIISRSMLGQQLPKPIKMKISHIKSHCSHVVMLCHEATQKGRQFLFLPNWHSRVNKSKKKVQHIVIVAHPRNKKKL
jgi:hypothetical protein